MTSYLGQVLRSAVSCCDRACGSLPSFTANWTNLRHLVDKLTLDDLQIDRSLIDDRPPYAPTTPAPRSPPCTFVRIFANDSVSISVFILSANYTMPIHDHPRMHGLIKTISGKISIQSYSVRPTTTTTTSAPPALNTSEFVPVTVEPAREFTSTSACAVLSPDKGNFHEITAVDGPAAFFDILTPPYGGSSADLADAELRKCSFYVRISGTPVDGDLLQCVPCPSHYWCDDADYELPANIFVTD